MILTEQTEVRRSSAPNLPLSPRHTRYQKILRLDRRAMHTRHGLPRHAERKSSGIEYRFEFFEAFFEAWHWSVLLRYVFHLDGQ